MGENWAFILIPKNGSQHIANCLSLNKRQRTTQETEPPDVPVYVMWRDPFDRLISAYEFLHRRDFIPDGFDKFVRHVCRQPDHKRNIHYRSQYGLCTWSEFRPTVIYRWDFDQFYRDFCIKEIPEPVNRSPDKSAYWTDELKRLYEQEYSNDFEIWEGLCQN